MDVAVNRQISEFVLDQPISGNEAAMVYRAYQPNLNRYVALKLVRVPVESLSIDSTLFIQRFTQEAEVLTSLEHPHIVPIYHYGIIETDSAYIAMRLMHGSLKDRLNDGPIPAERVVEIAMQLMSGLSYAHKKGVIHHDIKPTNILFDEAGSACLTDFGLSRITNQSLDLPQLDVLMGTAMYAAPEQIRNASTDHRSDIYSLGVIMYQMLTGHLPFDVENLSIVALLNRIEHDQPVLPRNFNPDIPIEIERVVMQALRKEPRERFFDAAEMIEALQAVPSNRVNYQRPSSISLRLPELVNRSSRPRRVSIIFSAIVLATLITLLFLLTVVARERNISTTPTVIEELRAGFEAAEPTAAEVAHAQQRLGTTGFIAFIACSLDSQFQATRAREMSDFAAGYGLAYRVYDSENDAYHELTLIERARLEGARAIILCPLKPTLLSESLTSVQRAGIPFVLTSAITNAHGGVMIETDNYAVGRLAGEFMAETLTASTVQANVIILTSPDTAYSDARVQGFIDALTEQFPAAQVVGQYPTGADRAASQSAIAELLSSNQTINAIFSVTDTGAYGASAALSNAEVPVDAVLMVSVNAESLALDQIYNQSYLRASVDIARESGSRGAIDSAIKLLGGGTVPQILTLPTGIVITRDIMLERSANE